MRNKILLPILLLATFALGACNVPGQSNNNGGTSAAQDTSEPAGDSSQDTTEYGVTIGNKEALQGEWYAGTNRDLDVTLSPAANPLAELGKNLTVESSDAEVVKVTGLGLSALKAGQATITVKYHNAEDTVSVTILDNSAKAKYNVAHEGTLEDPFTNEDALTVAKSEKYEGEVYYVKGKIASFYNAPGSRTDGMVAYYLEPATAGGEKFEIYKCFKEDGSALTDDDIWVGGEALAYGAFTVYNGQYETSSAIFVSCTGDKPEARKTLEKTFAETLALGVALADGADSYDYIKFQGYVTKKSGNNYFLTATKGEEIVSGKSDEAHGSRDIYTNAIELYNAGTVNDLVAILLEGAKVEVTMIVKNYHGTVENGFNLTKDDVKVIEAGQPWAIPATKATVAEALAVINGLEDGKTTDTVYEIEGYIVKVTTAWSAQYSNITFTLGATADAADDAVITVFRAKAATGTDGSALKAGDKVKVVGQLQKYVKDTVVTPELTAGETTLLEAAGGEVPAPTKKTVAEALVIINALEDGKTTEEQYEIEGYIVAITTAWSTQYNNITFTLGAAADATDVITVFRCGAASGTDGSALKAGDKVKVVGNLQKYVKNEAVTPELTGGVATLLTDSGSGGTDTTNYGTESEPLTVAQAKAIATAQLGEVDSYTPSMLWVKAYVTNIPTINSTYGWKNIYLGDSADAAQADCLLAYSVNKSDTCAKLGQHDFVLIHGALKNYSGTIEFTNVKVGDETIHAYPTFSARVIGNSSITLGDHEHATVSTLPESAANDTAITFTVTPDAGYVIASVKVNDKAIAGNEGQYSFELAGDSTIVVTTGVDGGETSKLTKASSIAVGDTIVLAVDNGTVKKQFNGISDTSTKYGLAEDYANSTPAEDVGLISVVAGKNANTFALKFGDKYLCWKSGNSLEVQDAIDENSSWTVTFENGNATILNVADSARKLRYNASSPRFACYTSEQTAVQLWKLAA